MIHKLGITEEERQQIARIFSQLSLEQIQLSVTLCNSEPQTSI